MRIGIFCDAFYPENKAVAIRLYHFADALAQLPDVKVTVHTCTRSSSQKNLLASVVHHHSPAPSNESSNVTRLFTELVLGVEMFFRILFSRYDGLLISSPPFFASVLASAAARLRRIPFVFDVRDEYPEVFFTAGIVNPNSRLGRAMLYVEKMVYRRALMVISVTEGICSRIDSKAAIAGCGVLVRNGFDDTLFIENFEKEEKFTVVFHGNIGKFQEPDLIIAVAETLSKRRKDIQFKVIGYGNNDRSLKSNLVPNLTFLGMVPYQEIPKIIGRAHLGISFRSDDLISFNSFPVKLYEYIGVAIPVIVTPKSEAGHFFHNNSIGFQFGNNDVDAIANKIVELAEDRELYSDIVGRIAGIRTQFSRQLISQTFANEFVNKIKRLGDNG